MELQDFVLKGVTSQLRWGVLTPRFIDRRGALIEALLARHDLTEWGYGEDVLEVFKQDQSIALAAGNQEARGIFENVEDTGEVASTCRSFFEFVLGELDISEVSFVGVRSYWLAPTDSFEGLTAWMIEKLSPGVGPLREAVGTKPTDAGWVFEFHAADPKHRLRLGPMNPQQAMAQFFRDKNEENYPPQFLFLDFDRVYNDDKIDRSAALDRWETSFGRNLEIGAKLGQLLSDTS
jgi:hypothetical protein